MYPVKEIDAPELIEWLSGDRTVRLIDVRSPAETARGIIEGAELIPLHLLPLNAEVIANTTAKEVPVVFYCRSGARSFQACAYFMQRGRDNVLNLRGGVIAWARSGGQFVLPDRAAN